MCAPARCPRAAVGSRLSTGGSTAVTSGSLRHDAYACQRSAHRLSLPALYYTRRVFTVRSTSHSLQTRPSSIVPVRVIFNSSEERVQIRFALIRPRLLCARAPQTSSLACGRAPPPPIWQIVLTQRKTGTSGVRARRPSCAADAPTHSAPCSLHPAAPPRLPPTWPRRGSRALQSHPSQPACPCWKGQGMATD